VKRLDRWAILVALAMVPGAVADAQASVFATEVVSYDTGTSASPPELEHPTYVNPLAALGEPTRSTAGWPPGTPADVTPFNGPWQDTELVSIGPGGWLSVKFDSPVQDHPQNPFGVDLLIFGNAGLIDTAWPNGVAGDPAALFGADTSTVSVSQDGLAWVDVPGADADGWWPTLGYTDSSGPYAGDGTVPTDFTRPVDPAADADGRTFADLVALYDGSGGGTGIDLAGTGLAWVQYVRVSVPASNTSDVDIDGFADVAPEPAALGLLALGSLALGLRRRR